ncbi:hypothetical protein J437_LFUL015551 [Ladona fulva]|uniref:Uncharacterized protein n=1 Tax=Ladona fulva TaxID=123851 RepID=A0A8K0P6E1_LADFU|nr:hypothetical protein J437_LFUL015551 [Ladona fulva]
MAIEDVQDLLVEEEVDEADLMKWHPKLLAENLESFFLNSSAERSRKFKRELQNCPFREIYNDLREEDVRTLNEEKSSPRDGDIIPPKKRSRLIVHTEQ